MINNPPESGNNAPTPADASPTQTKRSVRAYVVGFAVLISVIVAIGMIVR